MKTDRSTKKWPGVTALCALTLEAMQVDDRRKMHNFHYPLNPHILDTNPTIWLWPFALSRKANGRVANGLGKWKTPALIPAQASLQVGQPAVPNIQ